MLKSSLALLLLTVLLSGCARSADTSRKKVFEEAGIYVEYPGNWRVTKNKEINGARLVYIEESGDALVVITVFQKDQEIALPVYAEAITKNLGDAVPFNLVKGAEIKSGEESLDIVYSIDLAGMKVPHTANVTLHMIEGASVLCLTQVADEDRYNVQNGFELIRQTLRSAQPSKPNQSESASAAVTPSVEKAKSASPVAQLEN